MQDQDFYSQLLDHLSTALLVVGEDLHVAYINSSAQALLECSESRSRQAPVDQLFPGQTVLRQELESARDTGVGYTNRDMTIQMPSGQQLHVDLMVTPYHEPDGALLGLILEIMPVDRIMRISREENLISSQQNTRALIRGLAHEIKNPLGGVRGAAQLLARELPSAELQEYTNIIIEESDRLRDLVDRLLGPHQRTKPTLLNIHEILEHVRSLLLAEAGDSVQLERDYDPSLPNITGDRAQLIQAVLNIARNAMQATEANSGPRIITLRSRVQRQFTIGQRQHRLVMRLDITDNGPGIAEELKHSLFMPMVSSRADGSGLGLSISQSIIHQHNGLIECSSEPGCTVFTLFIPMEPEHAKS